jgi:hypothetical protein
LVLVGVVGELVAFIAFFSLSISVFLESMKHIIDVVFVIPKGENNSATHGKFSFAEKIRRNLL